LVATTWKTLPQIASLGSIGLGGTHIDAETLGVVTQKATAALVLSLHGPQIDDRLFAAAPKGLHSIAAHHAPDQPPPFTADEAWEPSQSRIRVLVMPDYA
jgi:hypothetical protein